MTTPSSSLRLEPEMSVSHQVYMGTYRLPEHSGVKFFDKVDGQLLEWAWQVYEASFRELNKNAVQRHLMFRPEFDEVMLDPRWGKYLAFNTDGDIIGLSTYTNNFDAHPLISTAYFERHHPEHYADRRVWLVGFVAVSADARGMVTFREIIKAMYETSGDDAITVIDYAKVNFDRGLPSAAARYLERITRERGHTVRWGKADYQGYVLYQYPRAEDSA